MSHGLPVIGEGKNAGLAAWLEATQWAFIESEMETGCHGSLESLLRHLQNLTVKIQGRCWDDGKANEIMPLPGLEHPRLDGNPHS